MSAAWSEGVITRATVGSFRTHALHGLVDFPRMVESDGSHGDWPISGWAMLARIGGTAGSIAALLPQRRATDAGALLRVMFESTVTLVWIGIDPDAHAAAWLRWDRDKRIRLDNDLQDRGAEPLLKPEVRAAFKQLIAEGPMMPDKLPPRAEQADKFWSPRAKVFEAEPASPMSLRGMYRYIYRRDSQYTHAAVASVEPLMRGTPPGPFHVSADEFEPNRENAFTMAPILYAMALIAAAAMFGLDGIEAGVDRVFTQYPEPAA